MSEKIDNASPEEMCKALLDAQPKKGVERSREGLVMLWKLYKADDHKLPYDEVDEGRNTVAAHFGWVCTHTARALGEDDPQAYALCNKTKDPSGTVWLQLKPSVVEGFKLAIQQFK